MTTWLAIKNISVQNPSFKNNSVGNVDISASELSQCVSESVERDSVHRSLRESKWKGRADKWCGFVYGFQKAIRAPLLSPGPSQHTGAEGLPAGLIRLEALLHKGFVQRFSPWTKRERMWNRATNTLTPQHTHTHTDADHHASAGSWTSARLFLLKMWIINLEGGRKQPRLQREITEWEKANNRGDISQDITLW